MPGIMRSRRMSRGVLGGDGQASAAVCGGEDVEAALLEIEADQFDEVPGIVDDKDGVFAMRSRGTTLVRQSRTYEQGVRDTGVS